MKYCLRLRKTSYKILDEVDFYRVFGINLTDVGIDEIPQSKEILID